MEEEKELVGITLYNPQIDRFRENIIKIINQVDKVLLINNNSNNIEDILKLINDINNEGKIEIINNSDNLGVATALNQILDYAYVNKYEWFLTLDQDSVCKENLIEQYKQYKRLSNIAMMTCIIKDRNYGIIDKVENDYNYIESCITSGTYNNTKILKNLGGFDESFFIDYVDYDMCETILENGYNIIRINFEGLLHEVGKTKVYTLFGKKEYIYNQPPFRTYYLIRNFILINKKHKRFNTLKNKLRVIKREILIMLFQKNKIKNLRAIIKANEDAMKMLKG